VRDIVPSRDDGDKYNEDDNEVENDESHPGKKVSLLFLYFPSSGECVVIDSRLPVTKAESLFLLRESVWMKMKE